MQRSAGCATYPAVSGNGFHLMPDPGKSAARGLSPANGSHQKNWRSLKECHKQGFSEENQFIARDTNVLSGSNRNNELETPSGHISGENQNENPGATAIATGAEDVLEGVCICGDYIACFPILATHWGMLI
ncbi:hypothetical protein [Roseobacter sp. S98]|uniref:hypothetical protein n=1 Tax=Roseobacter algicola (ex Choi et al. 2025) (nom. illeg.) TaxID=3092138 RepID=UPI003F512BA7